MTAYTGTLLNDLSAAVARQERLQLPENQRCHILDCPFPRHDHSHDFREVMAQHVPTDWEEGGCEYERVLHKGMEVPERSE